MSEREERIAEARAKAREARGRQPTRASREQAAQRVLERVEREVGRGGGNTEKARREAAEAIRRQDRKND